MRVVIAGAGYAGLTVALRLARANFPGEVVLVNAGPYHQLLTQIHRVASGSVPLEKVLLRIESLLRWYEVNFIEGKVTELWPDQRRVVLADGRELTYDRLVVALGGQLDTLGVPGVREYALAVCPVDQAVRTQQYITARLHDATFLTGAEREAALRFVIVGGGLTGVELAGELADRLPQDAARLGLRPSELDIVIMEAGPRLLPLLDERSAERATAFLERKRVSVRLETPVAEVYGVDSPYDEGAGGVVVRGGQRVPARTVIWAAGMRGHELVERAFAVDERGRAYVDAYLRARDYPDVYLVGDCARAVPAGWTRPAAPTAQNAVAQAELVADNLLQEATRGREAVLHPYEAKHVGTSAGPGAPGSEPPAGDFWKPRLSGFSAYAPKWSVEQRYTPSAGRRDSGGATD